MLKRLRTSYFVFCASAVLWSVTPDGLFVSTSIRVIYVHILSLFLLSTHILNYMIIYG